MIGEGYGQSSHRLFLLDFMPWGLSPNWELVSIVFMAFHLDFHCFRGVSRLLQQNLFVDDDAIPCNGWIECEVPLHSKLLFDLRDALSLPMNTHSMLGSSSSLPFSLALVPASCSISRPSMHPTTVSCSNDSWYCSSCSLARASEFRASFSVSAYSANPKGCLPGCSSSWSSMIRRSASAANLDLSG